MVIRLVSHAIESSKRDSDRTKSKDRSERAKERSKDDSKKRAWSEQSEHRVATNATHLVSKLRIVYYSRHDLFSCSEGYKFSDLNWRNTLLCLTSKECWRSTFDSVTCRRDKVRHDNVLVAVILHFFQH